MVKGDRVSVSSVSGKYEGTVVRVSSWNVWIAYNGKTVRFNREHQSADVRWSNKTGSFVCGDRAHYTTREEQAS